MLMKKASRLAAIFCTIWFCVPALAQKKAATGFYISAQGDTVQGVFPNYAQWGKNPSAVEFAAAASTPPIKLTPQNCRKFVVEGHEEYLAYVGQRLVNPIFDNDVIYKRYRNADDEPEAVATFLRLVTRTPNCELYVFTDSKRTNFFYKLPGDSVVELRYKKHYNEMEVIAVTEVYIVNQVKTITTYRNQINALFSEAVYTRKLTAALNALPYTEDGLKRFLEKLFAVKPVKRSQKNAAAGWIISMGTSFNYVKATAPQFLTGTVREYNSSVSPLLSIGYLFATNRNFGKYFFYPQLSFFRYKNTGEVNDGTFTKFTTHQTDLVIAGTVNGGVNVVNKQNIRLFLGGGAGMMGLVKNRQKDVKYLNTRPSGEPYRSEQTNVDLKSTPAITPSAGVEIKNKILIAATYLLPTKIDNAFNYNPKYSALQLRIGYKLG